MNEQTVGLIGLGLVGSALVERFVGAGYDVVGYDIDTDKAEAAKRLGCAIASSPAGVAERTCHIVLSLPTSREVSIVVEGDDGVLSTVRKHAYIIDTTTADPVHSAALAKRLHERGIRFLDATILGSSDVVRHGEAVVMVGGTGKDIEACHPLLSTFAKDIFAMGPNSAGATAKLVVNLVLGLNRLVLAEGLVLGEKSGLDTNALLSVLRAGGAYSRVMDTKGEKMLAREYDAEARLAQHLKDVGLILDLGARTGTPLLMSAIHQQLLLTAVSNGLGDADNSAIIEVLRSMAGDNRVNANDDLQHKSS